MHLRLTSQNVPPPLLLLLLPLLPAQVFEKAGLQSPILGSIAMALTNLSE